MFEILAYWKETDNKLRWDTKINGVLFEVYIPKWRIPDPRPETILVILYFPPYDQLNNKKFYCKSDITLNPQLRNNKICADLQKNQEHSKTMRFDPIGDKKSWEVGSLYIPFDLLPGKEITQVTAVIEWIYA